MISHALDRLAFLARQAILLTLLLVIYACSSFQRTEDPLSKSASEAELSINNTNFHDATLYAHWLPGGLRRRIGIAPGKSTTKLTVEVPPTASQLRLEVRILATRTYVTAPMPISAGDLLSLTIPIY